MVKGSCVPAVASQQAGANGYRFFAVASQRSWSDGLQVLGRAKRPEVERRVTDYAPWTNATIFRRFLWEVPPFCQPGAGSRRLSLSSPRNGLSVSPISCVGGNHFQSVTICNGFVALLFQALCHPIQYGLDLWSRLLTLGKVSEHHLLSLTRSLVFLRIFVLRAFLSYSLLSLGYSFPKSQTLFSYYTLRSHPFELVRFACKELLSVIYKLLSTQVGTKGGVAASGEATGGVIVCMLIRSISESEHRTSQ